MKKLLPLFLILSTAQLFATATASGKLLMPSGAGATPGYVLFTLENCGGNYPTVSGASITPTQKFTLAADGSWSGQLYRNDEITCNGVASTTWWHKQYFVNGTQVGPAVDYICAQTSCVFDGVGGLTPITVYPPPTPPVQPLTGAESVVCSFAAPASTWTCTENMGTQQVVAQFFNSSSQEIFPDTATATDVNTFTATFLTPQSGFMRVVNVGNWTPSTLFPNYIIGNPTSSQTIASSNSLTLAGPLLMQSTATESQAGIFTNLQAQDAFSSLLNNANQLSDFQAVQGGSNFYTAAVTGAINVPSNSTVYQANAVQGYVNSAAPGSPGGGTNSVAGYFEAHATGNNANIWGFNSVVIDNAGLTTGLKLLNEYDVQPQNAPSAYTTINGALFNLFAPGVSNNSVFTNSFATFCSKGQTGGIWQSCYNSADGAAGTFATIGSATTSANSASQPINFNSRDGSNVVRTSALTVNSQGNFNFNPFGGNVISPRFFASPPAATAGVSVTPNANDTNPAIQVTNAANSAIVAQITDLGQVQTPSLALNSGTALTAQTGSGTSIVTNVGPTITGTTTLSTLATTTLAVGGGTTINAENIFSLSITPTAVGAASSAEQNFAFGVSASDHCSLVDHPAWGNSATATSTRTVGANSVAITFTNPTAGSLTPTSGTYVIRCVH